MDKKNNKKLDEIQNAVEQQQSNKGIVAKWNAISQCSYDIADSRRLDLINVDHGAFRLSLDVVQDLEKSIEGDVLDGYLPVTPNMLAYLRKVVPDYAKVFEKALSTTVPSLDDNVLAALDFKPFRVKVGDIVSLSSTLTRPPEDGSSRVGQRAGQYNRLALNFYIFCSLLDAATKGVDMNDAMADNLVFANLNQLRANLGLDEATILGSFKVKRYVKRENRNYASVEKVKK